MLISPFSLASKTRPFDEFSSWALSTALFSLPRSVSGSANIETLRIISDFTDGALEIKQFDSRSFYTWDRPRFWDFEEGYIATLDGTKLVDSNERLLHVVSHSRAVDKIISFEKLRDHLYKGERDEVPYRTSFYNDNWGFCVSRRQYAELEKYEKLRVVIKADFKDQELPYGECFFPGHETDRELLITSYICHPDMANNELSGILLLARLIKTFKSLSKSEKLPIGVRFLLAPETIGSIAYINQHLDSMRRYIDGVLVCSCVGDGRMLSVVKGRRDDQFSRAVRITAKSVAAENKLAFKVYGFRDRGADERQFASPHVNLDVTTLCNSKFGAYPEYHSSEDDLSIISESAIAMSAGVVLRALDLFARNTAPILAQPCEPMLSKVGIYPHSRDYQKTQTEVMQLLDFSAYSDGQMSLIDMAEYFDWSDQLVTEIHRKFLLNGLLRD